MSFFSLILYCVGLHDLLIAQELKRFDPFLSRCCRALCFWKQHRNYYSTILLQFLVALGKTVGELNIAAKQAKVFEKTRFSMMTEEVLAALQNIPDRNSVVLFGIEVNVMQLKMPNGVVILSPTIFHSPCQQQKYFLEF